MAKKPLDPLTRLFMSKGPLDARDTVEIMLPSAKHGLKSRKEKIAYHLGVYEMLLFLAVSEFSPKTMAPVLDALLNDCVKKLPSRRFEVRMVAEPTENRAPQRTIVRTMRRKK